jgi:hypothetical protein
MDENEVTEESDISIVEDASTTTQDTSSEETPSTSKVTNKTGREHKSDVFKHFADVKEDNREKYQCKHCK